MGQREDLLCSLNETVAQLMDLYQNIPDPDVLVNPLWSAKDVLAHITFWYESFARNVEDLECGQKPAPLKGRLVELNQSGVDNMRAESLDTVMARFQRAHQIIQENILHPDLVQIPYRKGSRDYPPEEHLDIVCKHIQGHYKDVRKAIIKGCQIPPESPFGV